MAEVFRTHRRYRVVVRSNDHPPPHVHVLGRGVNARVKLNCPDGPVEFWDYKGELTRDHLNEFLAEIAVRLADCCKVWSDIHG